MPHSDRSPFFLSSWRVMGRGDSGQLWELTTAFTDSLWHWSRNNKCFCSSPLGLCEASNCYCEGKDLERVTPTRDRSTVSANSVRTGESVETQTDCWHWNTEGITGRRLKFSRIQGLGLALASGWLGGTSCPVSLWTTHPTVDCRTCHVVSNGLQWFCLLFLSQVKLLL